MKLVEVVRAELTSDVTVDTAVAFIQRIGKLPVVVRDQPGFLVNRILLPHLLEAVRLFNAGAEVTAIDESMLDFGMPMGPLRLLDEVGLDVASDVAQTLLRGIPGPNADARLFSQLLEVRIRGRKTGKGFYRIPKRSGCPCQSAPRWDFGQQEDAGRSLPRAASAAHGSLNDQRGSEVSGGADRRGPEGCRFCNDHGNWFCPIPRWAVAYADAARHRQDHRGS